MNKKQTQIKVETTNRGDATPMDCRLIGDSLVNLTMEKAAQYLEYKSFSGERSVSQQWVQHLMDEYLGGRFNWNLVTVIVGVLQNQTAREVYRLNSQHCCWMRYLIPKEKVQGKCMVRQLVYECRTTTGLRELYAGIDRGRARSTGHSTKVLLIETADQFGIPSSLINSLVVGMKTWLWEDEATRNVNGSPYNMANLINGEHNDLFRIVGGFSQQYVNSWFHIKRSSVMAALFATFQRNAGVASDFWSSVASGVGFTESTDARLRLRTFIETHRMSSRTTSAGVASQEEIYRHCINCWNKWRRGEMVENMRCTEKRVAPLR